ncbi:MAG: START-like domain-containing protein [Bacteroidota bacterium]
MIKAPEVKKSDSSQSVSPPPPALPRKVIRTTFSSSSLKDKKREVHPNEYSFEYVMHASPALLFEMISTPSGLSEWFANDVNIRDGNFTFFWDGSEQVAKQIAYKDLKLVRFRWLDKPEYTFFEFRIEVDELTNESSLIITDFAEDGDKESARMLWDNEIAKLKKAIGS